jgi:ferredoxin
LDVLDSLDLTLRALNTRIPEADPQRCVATRYQASSCRRCLAVCPVDAITPTPSLDVDPGKCVGCGACAVVCPTGALDFAQPRAALRAGLRAAGAAAGAPAATGKHGTGALSAAAAVTIACARADLSAGRGSGIRVECLGGVGAADLLVARAAGVASIHFVDGGCDTCRSRPATAGLPAALSAAGAVATAFAPQGNGQPDVAAEVSDLLVTRTSSSLGASPTDTVGASARSMGPVLSRRQVLLFFGLRSAQVVKTSTIKPGRSVGSLHAQKAPPPVHQQLLAALAKLAPRGTDTGSAPPDALIEPLHLATVVLSPGCDACGLCVRYCPHGALRTADGRLLADPDLCTACGLCTEVCPPGAISLAPPEPFA